MKFYMHAGSLNHGCEAIVKSTIKMCQDKKVILYSEHPKEDLVMHLDRLCDVKVQGGLRSKKNPVFIFCKVIETIWRKSNLKKKYVYKNLLNEVQTGELYLSIGGDNYCYGANPYLMFLNREINRRGGKTALWGCSIEPELLLDKDIAEDMSRYSFISARESITYEALKNAGLKNVFLFPDPAFTLEIEKCDLPAIFSSAKVIGINLSPLVQKLDETKGNVYENYKRLVEHILKNTEFSILLIPHVCKPGNDDRTVMRILQEEFPGEERIFMVNQEGNMSCSQLKYIIGKCYLIVAARTHASIAAYSQCVPTLVAGYSVKATGIAKDLFGDVYGKVIDIRKMQTELDLTGLFCEMVENVTENRKFLQSIMPNYISNAYMAKDLLIGYE